MQQLCLIFILITATPIVCVDSQLVQVQILFRHGMRAPERPYPSSPNKDDSIWPNGWGQLTQFGKEQQYQLGKFMRERYSTFISNNYDMKEIHVISSDVDRTIMSAQLAMAGFYSETNSTFDDNLQWEPVPIHTISSGSTQLMLHPSYVSRSDTCPRFYHVMRNELKELPEYKAIEEKYSHLIEIVRNGTGESADFPWIGLYGGHVGTLTIERFYNLTLPDWANEVLDSKEQMDIKESAFGMLTATHETKRLLGGPMLEEWMKNMENMTKKFHVYSGHDLTIVNVMNTLGLNEPPFTPEMGSAFFVELHYDNGNYIVKFFYRDGITAEVNQLQLPNCTLSCSLESFKLIVAPFIPEDLDMECEVVVGGGGNRPLSTNATISTLNVVLISVICALVVVMVTTQLCRFRRKKGKEFPVYT